MSPQLSGKVSAAAMLVAAGLDTYLPRIRAWEGSLAEGTTAPGCDLVDEAPILCVSSDANNTYVKDVVLSIDLGGSDIYRNSAGGTPFYSLGSSMNEPLSINIDLGGGDDSYESPPPVVTSFTDQDKTWRIGSLVAQGAGYLGVGLLIDDGGDDSYSATVDTGEAINAAVVDAQGSGQLGFGGLFDEGGNDTYRIAGTSQPEYAPQGVTYRIEGQGAGSGGVGVLSDVGQGDDSYTLAREFSQRPDFVRAPFQVGADSCLWLVPGTAIYGQGYATLGGSGVLSDDGGTDAFHVAVTTEWTPDRPLPPEPCNYTSGGHPFWAASAPFVQIQAQAVAEWIFDSGTAMLLEGTGPTTYSARVDSRGPSLVQLSGQAYQNTSPSERVAAAIDDIGGDDSYTLALTQSYSAETRWTDACEQDRSACESDAGLLDQTYGSVASLTGQAVKASCFAACSGRALLEDHSGNDSYMASSDYRLEGTLLDQRSDISEPVSLHVQGSQPFLFGLTREFAAQGVVSWSGPDLSGWALMIDDAGSDSYTARYAREVRASVTPSSAAQIDRLTADNFGRIGVFAQGAAHNSTGLGGLFDLAGEKDRFLASAELKTETLPTGNARSWNFPAVLLWPYFQGSSNHGAPPSEISGPGVFYAGGTDPTIVARPSQVVCGPPDGRRGDGLWAECNDDGGWGELVGPQSEDPDHAQNGEYRFGVGIAPNAVAQVPTLRITDETPVSVSAPYTCQEEGKFPVAEAKRIPVSARLVGPNAEPVAGALVHFDLQFDAPTLPPSLGGFWTAFTSDAVTDQDGVARATLPLDVTDLILEGWPGVVFRVFATFDGDEGLTPRHAASALEVAPPTATPACPSS